MGKVGMRIIAMAWVFFTACAVFAFQPVTAQDFVECGLLGVGLVLLGAGLIPLISRSGSTEE